MLSNGFAIPIRISPASSRIFRILVIAVHGLAVFALILPSALPVWLRLLLGVGVLISCLYHLKRQTGSQNTSWVYHELCWRNTEDKDQRCWHLSEIHAINNWFVSFSLRTDEGLKYHILIFHDQLDIKTFRCLRVYLRFAQVDATSPGETI